MYVDPRNALTELEDRTAVDRRNRANVGAPPTGRITPNHGPLAGTRRAARLAGAVLGLATTVTIITSCDSGSTAPSTATAPRSSSAPTGRAAAPVDPDSVGYPAGAPSGGFGAGHGIVTTDVDGHTVIVPPVFGPPIPATSIADVKAKLSVRWPVTFRQDGPTAHVEFTLPGSPRQLRIGVRSAPDDTSGRVGMLQCWIRQTGLAVDDGVLDFIRSCLDPALTGEQHTSVATWLGAHAASVTSKEISQRQDLGTAWLYAVRMGPDDFYVRLVGK